MVHFSSFTPSYGARKNYINHTIARPGQWRNLRPSYVGRNRTVIVRNYNNCCGGHGGNGLMNVMNWMMVAQMGMQLLSPLADLFGSWFKRNDNLAVHDTSTTQVVDPNAGKTPVTTVVDPDAGKNPVVEPEKDDNDGNLFSNWSGEYDEETTGATEDQVVNLTGNVTIPKTTKKTVGNEVRTYYTGWATFQAACTATKGDEPANNVVNTEHFRNFVRNEFFNGADIWTTGAQDFPKEFTYTDKDGNEYKIKVNLNDLADKTKQKDFYVTTGTVTEQKGTAKTTTIKGQTGKTTYKGVKASVTVTVNGKATTYTSEAFDGDDLGALKTKARNSLKAKYPSLTQEQLNNIKFTKKKAE